jgi:hypothetical protein
MLRQIQSAFQNVFPVNHPIRQNPSFATWMTNNLPKYTVAYRSRLMNSINRSLNNNNPNRAISDSDSEEDYANDPFLDFLNTDLNNFHATKFVCNFCNASLETILSSFMCILPPYTSAVRNENAEKIRNGCLMLCYLAPIFTIFELIIKENLYFLLDGMSAIGYYHSLANKCRTRGLKKVDYAYLETSCRITLRAIHRYSHSPDQTTNADIITKTTNILLNMVNPVYDLTSSKQNEVHLRNIPDIRMIIPIMYRFDRNPVLAVRKNTRWGIIQKNAFMYRLLGNPLENNTCQNNKILEDFEPIVDEYELEFDDEDTYIDESNDVIEI